MVLVSGWRLLKAGAIARGLGRAFKGQKAVTQGVRSGSLDIGAGGAGGLLRASGAAAKTFVRSLRTPQTFKGALRGIGARFGKALGAGAGTEAVRSAVTGDPAGLNPRRLALGALGYGVGGLPGLAAGSLVGGVQLGSRAGVKLVREQAQNIPGVQFRDFGPPLSFDQGDVIVNLPGGPPGDVGIPSGSFSAGFGAPALNVGVGGGGLDFSTLALLGLIGGGGLFGAGVVAGKKKKKKKKKRSKRKKEDDDDE